MMVSKSKRLRQNTELLNKTIKRIGYLSVFVFLVKLLIIWRISNLTISQAQGHIWLGADGEPYLTATDGLLSDGILSKQDLLSYWPAGYPILIFLITFLGKTWALTILAIFQSALFSFAVFKLGKVLIVKGLKTIATLVFTLIMFNPTLTLSSMVIGYESIVGSLFILMFSFFIENLSKNYRNFRLFIKISSLGSVICFFQPRFLITIPILILILGFVQKNRGKKYLFFALISSIIILSIAPITLIVRNYYSVNMPTISTNLGVTMNIGAGDSSGGYVKNPPGVPCEITETRKDKADSQRIRCVIAWYLQNPSKASKLFFNKSIYFWSPWFGPEANGTMARNPWLTVHPLKNMTKTPDGLKLLYGPLGKSISWLWLLSGIFLTIFGNVFLWRQRGELRIISFFAIAVIASSWLVTLISIGDHRFRLPVMGLTLFSQAVGIKAIMSQRKSLIVQPVNLG